MEGIEPAAGLVDAFRDEIRRIVPGKDLFVLERKMPLGIRHRAAVEPKVDKAGDPLHRATRLTDQDDIVHKRLVEMARKIFDMRLFGHTDSGFHKAGFTGCLKGGFEFGNAPDANV